MYCIERFKGILLRFSHVTAHFVNLYFSSGTLFPSHGGPVEAEAGSSGGG